MSGDWGAAAQSLGQQAVKKITVRTQFSPPVVVDPFAPAPPGPPAPNPLMMLIRPEVTIEGPGGKTIIAPYGTPSQNYLPWLLAGLAIVGLGVLGAVAMIARRVGR